MKKSIILFLFLLVGCNNLDETPSEDDKPIGVIECNIDNDCSVGGCSGQSCLTNELAQNLMTTCEYKEEYGCYKLTSCGCVNNKCQWAENSNLNECLDNFK